MAFKYISNSRSPIHYICQAADTKGIGDVGTRLYESDTGKHYINKDGTATGWVEYKDASLYSV